MDKIKIGDGEIKIMEYIWERDSIKAGEIVQLAQKDHGWSKNTTYTMLKRLCERGLFQNNGGEITPLKSREEFHTEQGEQFFNQSFSGSLPQFVAAFMKSKRLKPKEMEEIVRLIQEYKEE